MNSDDLKIIFKNLIYLNMSQLKTICNKYYIPYNIYIQKNNDIIKTNEIDHKIIIINNIKKYLKNNVIPRKTIYKEKIINYNNNEQLYDNSYIYYGQYKTTNKQILNIMKNLTDNKFKFGAISQKIIRNIWRSNKLITYKEFAELWINENNIGIKYPELAYNEFMKSNGDRDKWHQNKKDILIIFKKFNLL
jgi:hypothetical protein